MVSAVVAARVDSVLAPVALHFVWQVSVVADVDHLVAVDTSGPVCLRNHGAADATNQVHDATCPANGNGLVVHGLNGRVALVAAVVAVVVFLADEVGMTAPVLDCADAFLDVVDACHVDVFLRGRRNAFYLFQKKAFQFFCSQSKKFFIS